MGVQAQNAEADADARYIAERESAAAAEEADIEKRIDGFSGTLAIATFTVLQQWVGTPSQKSLVFANLAEAKAHGERSGARGPFNLTAREVAVAAGRCSNDSDTR